ncbi:hypothetical protein K6W24_18710, partial [Burkholderia dolosa]|uniref:hypothetical protein n=1 Tax=Burkholderia dolosa TaxID=152500 RepID=UPI001C93540E
MNRATVYPVRAVLATSAVAAVLPVAAAFANLSAFLWARRLNSTLSTRLHKSLAEQDSKLVH